LHEPILNAYFLFRKKNPRIVTHIVGRVTESVERLATGWTVRGSNPGGCEIFRPGAHPASCTMGTGSFPGVNSGRGVTLTPHPFLVPWSRKGRAIPLLPLWAVRPVQSLSACTRVTFTLNFTFHNTYYNISPRRNNRLSIHSKD